MALLVSTPRFCQSDVCGPTVGLLRSALRVRSGKPWTTVHAEVYTGPETGDFSTTATVSALGLTFEPSLMVADAGGIVTAGLHYRWTPRRGPPRWDQPSEGRSIEQTVCDQKRQLNDWPQPQVRWAFGLSIENPASFKPSL
ncbi:MAG: hypothetical protein CM1200mP26_02940 [Acidimicrobiales bacterium]|nr:MAG: hypothetical protein CM1200mP26_02940 [Acidimicrobiales bacterium]